METHDWQCKKCQRSMQTLCSFCPGVILAPAECPLQTKPRVTAPEKRLAKVQGFSFLVWNTSTKTQEAFSVLLLWSLQMLWKCSWWRQACKRCCLRSCWGSRVVHKLKIHALWRLHQISLSPCFLEVKKKGILTVQIHKETTSGSPLSGRIAICSVAFVSNTSAPVS